MDPSDNNKIINRNEMILINTKAAGAVSVNPQPWIIAAFGALCKSNELSDYYYRRTINDDYIPLY